MQKGFDISLFNGEEGDEYEKNEKAKTLTSDRMFDIFNYTFLAILLVIVAYPLYYVLIPSISDPYEVYAGKTFLFPRRSPLKAMQRYLRRNPSRQAISTMFIIRF